MGIIRFDSNSTYYDLLNGFESPELTFKDKTLKEAIFKAVEELDVIPRIKYDATNDKLELDLDFVNKLKNLIESENDFTSQSRVQDVDYYATNMESELLNATNSNNANEGVEIYPAKGLFTTPRSTSYIYDFLSSYITTPKRIGETYKLFIKTEDMTVSKISPSADVYVNDNKLLYCATLPTTGQTSLLYVDMSASEAVYTWDGSSFIANGNTASDYSPKVRFISDFATFTSTLNNTDTKDIYIDRNTGTSYKYDSGTTSYVELNNIDKDGNIVMDASDRVFERNAYNALDADVSTGLQRRNPSNFLQANTFYYDYRKKNVNFGARSGILDTVTSLQLVVYIKLFEALQDDGFIPFGDTYDEYTFTYTGVNSIERDSVYQLHYRPLPVSVRASVDRKDTNDIDRYSTILNNQAERIIELSSVLDNMEGKINKLGNSELMVSQRVTDYNDLFEVGDYTNEGFVVTNRELIFFNDYIDAKYELTKNYNRLSKFIGVQSEVRQYEMGENNTLQRKLMYEEYVEVNAYNSINAPNGVNTSALVQDMGIKSYLSTFDKNTAYSPVRGGMITTDGIVNYVLAPFSSNGGGNSLLFEMQIPSNINAGDILENESGQIARNYTPYTLSDGKFEELNIILFDEIKEPFEDAGGVIDIGETLVEKGDVIPQVETTHIVNEYISNGDNSAFKVFKDNREEIGMSYSLKTYTTDYNTIIFGNKLFRRNSLVTELPPSDIKLYAYTTEVFDRTTTKQIPSGGTSLTPVMSLDYTNQKLSISNNLSSFKSWCLTDENDNILIAVNQGDTELNTLVFNFRNKRKDINYNY